MPDTDNEVEFTADEVNFINGTGTLTEPEASEATSKMESALDLAQGDAKVHNKPYRLLIIVKP